jgi:hypothetical protein
MFHAFARMCALSSLVPGARNRRAAAAASAGILRGVRPVVESPNARQAERADRDGFSEGKQEPLLLPLVRLRWHRSYTAAQVNQIIRPLEHAKEYWYMQTTCSECSRDRKCVGYFG